VYDPSRPLTRLERVLAVASILLLVLSGVFIGLFAQTEHALKKERGKHHPGNPDAPDGEVREWC
jgi:endothelin-converting enzyme